MKKLILSTVVALGLTPMVSFAEQCFANQRIVWVSTGYVDSTKGADDGNAVYFRLEDGRTYPMNPVYNVNDRRGQALYRMLMAALAGQLRTSGYDHYGTKCDDIDEIYLHRP